MANPEYLENYKQESEERAEKNLQKLKAERTEFKERAEGFQAWLKRNRGLAKKYMAGSRERQKKFEAWIKPNRRRYEKTLGKLWS